MTEKEAVLVADLVAGIERDIAPIDVVVFDVGGNVRSGITETTGGSIAKSGKWVPAPVSW